MHYQDNLKNMDFHEIEAFVALADTLHFARAAARIHLSPSALSRLLSRLEEELAVTLFERDTRRVSLTHAGTTFLDFARDSLLRRDELKLQIGNQDNSLHGIFRIYASVTACYSILQPFAETLSAEHPGLRLSVETGDPADAADAVREGRVEIALGAIPEGGFTDLEARTVRITPLVFATSESGSYTGLDLPDNLATVLSNVPLILPKSGLARERFDRWSRLKGIRANIAAETAGNEALLALARLGLGLALVPRLVLENGPFAEGLVIYDAGVDFGDYNIGFMQKNSSSGTPGERRLRTAVQDIIRRTYPV